MSTLLYRVGRAGYARPWLVIGGWLVLAVVIVVALVANPVRLSNEIRIDGTPAQNVIDDLAVAMPEAAGGQGLIAFQAPAGQRLDQGDGLATLSHAVDQVYTAPHVIDARKVMATEAARGADSPLLRAAGALAQLPTSAPVDGSTTPVPLVVDGQPVPGVSVSADGTVALLQFQFDAQTFELPDGTVQNTIDVAEAAVAGSGIAVLPSQTMLQIPELIGVGEIVGIAIAALVLLVTLGSVVAAGLPLVTALAGVGAGVGGAFTLSHLIEMHSLAAVLALMLGLAVGIDYALFIVNRQRRLILDHGLDAREATARAIGTAGSAVFFAGTTVVIALVALLVVDIRLLTTMALVAAATVVLAVLSALTLLPALLGLVGDRIVSPAQRRRAQNRRAIDGTPHPLAARWSGLLTRHGYLAAAAAVLVAAVVALPALGMSLGLPSGASYNPDTSQRRSYDAVADTFGAGYNGPLVIVAHARDAQPVTTENLLGLYRDLAGTPGVAAVALGGFSADARTAVLSVVPTTGPADTATADLVRTIRDRAPDYSASHALDVGVTGFAALTIDISDRMADVLPVYIAVVLVLSLLVLLLVFRSILVPIKATIGFLFSVGATFGATTAVFQWGWLQRLLGIDATSPVLCILPIIVTGVLYGLAMDYEMFLVSSMRGAHVHGHHGKEAVRYGFGQASRVVVAAALIMTSVFAGFIFNAEPMVKQVGFALAVGVLVDAFVVRLTFVPAAMAVFGDHAWWLPRWLDRILPDLDIEGDRLTRLLGDASQTAVEDAEAETADIAS